jgi:hypothetical protein
VVVWERDRGKPLKLKSRSAGAVEVRTKEAEALFESVTNKCQSQETERIYVRGQFSYDGLPLRGELWLDDSLRLGPPSKQDETALLGPRVILVDWYIDAIDAFEAASVAQVKLRELSVFLSVVMRSDIRDRSGSPHRAWTWPPGAGGIADCDVRNLGYVETQVSQRMPSRGQVPEAPLKPITRPDVSIMGIFVNQSEQSFPADMSVLWRLFASLSSDRRQQFLEVATMWKIALTLSREYPTAGFTYMVAACEALKPREQKFRDHNIYQVIEALLGKPVADVLQEDWFRPQTVRNSHLHSGQLHGSEFIQHT